MASIPFELNGKTVYVAVSDADGWGSGVGYLLALDAKTLATSASIRLHDPKTPANDALMNESGTASPTIGPLSPGLGHRYCP